MAEKLQPFICGGMAACFSSSVIHPIDLTKVRLQLAKETPQEPRIRPGALQVVRETIANEGVRGLYSGLSAALTRQATYGTARIGFHRVVSNWLVEFNDGNAIPFWQKTLSGLSSGALAVCIGTPFDVALVRMQADGLKPVDQRRNYRGIVDALSRITRSEGVSGLWSGIVPSILRGMAMNVGMLACYDEAKQVIVSITNNPDSMTTKLGSSAIAGFCCSFLSLPFDMIKSRLQNAALDPATGLKPYAGVADCANKILRREGIFAFWTGFSAYFLRCAPHAMITLLSIEIVTDRYQKFFGLEADKKLRIASRFTSTGTVSNVHEEDTDMHDERDD